MYRFIWNSWWRNKERFILLIIGALIVSIGLSYLVGITQANNATVVDELQKRWKSSYDIVVRPPGSRSVTEDMNLLEPNYLSGLAGGISLEQYEQIKAMSDVGIAAPIAMMGYIRNSTQLEHVEYNEPGIYRMHVEQTTNTGASKVKDGHNFYFTVGWEPPNIPKEYGVTHFNGELTYGSQILVAGIDPEEESGLVGIDNAIMAGKFLSSEDTVRTINQGQALTDIQIPVILSNQGFVDGKKTFTVEKLDIPFEDDPTSVMESIKNEGGKSYLDEKTRTRVDQYSFTTQYVHQKIVERVRKGTASLSDMNWMSFKPSSVNYREVTSPYADRWPFAYEVEPYIVPEDSLLAVDHAYRPISMFSEDSARWPRLRLDFQGVFDPKKLNISKDPLTELPMETYFPAQANWVLNKNENPVNPPKEMKPLNNPYGFLTKPPMLLTTIEASAEVLGEKPISAIRVKVKEVEQLTEESEQIIQAVANEIEEKTGLITDITLGSSPQPALTHIPGVNDQESLGWVEQPWIKLGSSITIFQESKIGMSGVIASVIAVAIVYVFTSNIIMMYARKKEFAVLLSVGWQPSQLTKLLFVEAGIIGLFVSIISWLILGFIYVTNDIETTGWRLLLIGIFGVTVYILGALIPGILVRRISPYETMKTGEVSRRKRRLLKTTSIIGMSLNNLLAKWKRSLLSIIAIALPTSLLILFLFVTFQLSGTLFTTWLGEYVALEVGPMHFVAMGVAIAIAILTTAEIIWQNVAERQPELAALKAFGWKNGMIRRLVLIEGALSGLIAGIFGLLIAFAIIWIMYDQFPLEELPFLLATILIPILTGITGAILPAGKAAKTQPYQGLTGGVVNSKKIEQRFQYVFAVMGFILFLGIIVLLTQTIPEIQETSQPKETGTVNTEGTSGNAQETVSTNNEESENGEQDTNKKQETKDFIQNKINKARLELPLGKTVETGFGIYGFELANTPENTSLQETEEKESITLLTNRKTLENDASIQYTPHLAYRLFDEKGNEYEVANYKVLKDKNWNKISLDVPGHVKLLLTYEVPKDSNRLILYGKEWFGDIVVIIK